MNQLNTYISRNSKIGIITYNYSHLKTEQVVNKLINRGYRNLILFALPFVERPQRTVVISHRPNQFQSTRMKDLAEFYNTEYIVMENDDVLTNCDFYIITGAGILSSRTIANKYIINAHAGIIPSSRGLDSFKWSIFNSIQLGITLHFIDENIDKGEIISVIKTPVFKSDTIQTLAARHYELEIECLSNFDYYLTHRTKVSYPLKDVTKRMPLNIEYLTIQRFNEYKEKFT